MPLNDTLGRYRFQVTNTLGPGPRGCRCIDCGATFPRAEGSVMRSHAKSCPVNPRTYHVPAVCDA